MTVQERWGGWLKGVARSTPSPEFQRILEKIYHSLKGAAEKGVCSEEKLFVKAQRGRERSKQLKR